jgi:putative ABC transport system ATP-binding protein
LTTLLHYHNILWSTTAVPGEPENVELPLFLTGLSRKERKAHVEFVLEIVALQDRLDHYPAQLSGGQQQRAAIAGAVVTDPAIIIADEPTGDLDRVSAGGILELLACLNQDLGKTIIMVTHDQRAADRAH